MLAKKFRLPIGAFPAKAKTLYKGDRLTIKAVPNKLSYDRVGIILTKKTAPRATERNRLRRKMFDLFGEAVRLRSDGAAARQSEPKDLLVIVKPIKLDQETEAELLAELTLFNERH